MSVYSSERNAGGCYSGYDSYDAFGEFGQCATYELDQDMVWGPGDYSLDVSSGELISGSSGGSSDASSELASGSSGGSSGNGDSCDASGSSSDLIPGSSGGSDLTSGSSGGSSDASGSSGAEFSWKTVDYGGSSVDLF